MWFSNGCLIQELTGINNTVKTFEYSGMNAYCSDPLFYTTIPEIKNFSLNLFHQRVSHNQYTIFEFISNYEALKQYVEYCAQLEIKIRALFVRSQYSKEVWQETLPQMNLIGYEYCPLPIDDQIITDLDWYEPLSKFKKRLNSVGLFDEYEQVLEFKSAYDHEFNSGKIGDGEMDAFVFEVYEIDLKSIACL